MSKVIQGPPWQNCAWDRAKVGDLAAATDPDQGLPWDPQTPGVWEDSEQTDLGPYPLSHPILAMLLVSPVFISVKWGLCLSEV